MPNLCIVQDVDTPLQLSHSPDKIVSSDFPTIISDENFKRLTTAKPQDDVPQRFSAPSQVGMNV